ncbi:MAG: ABC transporter permease [Vicinamibacterales bacterium]
MKLPGSRLRAIAARPFAAETMARLVDPAIADLQAEYAEASRRGPRWRRTAIRIRGLIALVTMLAAHTIHRVSLQGVSLDVRLALRLLVKHMGLTLVGVVAMAFAIWCGLLGFELYVQLMRPTMPLEGGDRIVGVVMTNAADAGEDTPTLHDFTAWRTALTSIEHVAAFRSRELNVIVGDEAAEPVEAAEITAAAFQVTQVRPVRGRTLIEADEKLSAPPVVLVGEHVWRTKFASDPGVIGRELRLANVAHTIVGVMPEGFRFPWAQHYWVPLKLDVVNFDRRQSPSVRVFGRLAPGATLETAQQELGVLGGVAAAQFPDTHTHLRPRALPYIRSVFGGSYSSSSERVLITQILGTIVVMLLVLICGNVALLLFARATTRETEMLVRAALGASRGRIVAQLFVEALVLAVIAGIAGAVAAQAAWGYIFDVVTFTIFEEGPVPFWLHRDLSPGTIPFALLLTPVAAAIAGFLPGLKVTRGLGARLRQTTPGGGGLRFGGMWTVLIVMQVAVMVAVPFFLHIIRAEKARHTEALTAGFQSGQYLSALVSLDWNRTPGSTVEQFVARLSRGQQELERRLEAEPGVLGVTFADRLPLKDITNSSAQLDDGGRDHWVSREWIALDFFDVMDAPVLAGRRFHSGDLLQGARSVIVNQSFVRLVSGGRNPIGRRIRYRQDEPWYEIVGVIEDLGVGASEQDPRIHHPIGPGRSHPVQMAILTSSDPKLFASRLRTIATAVDPQLRLTEVMPLDQARASSFKLLEMLFRTIGMLAAIVLLVSLSGIYSVFAFTAARRTREIGIRMALGADRRQIAAVMFRRPMIHVALGVLLGLVVRVVMLSDDISPGDLARLAFYGLVVAAVCALATVGPVRRALGVQPTEALRAE